MDPFAFMYAGVPGVQQFTADLHALVDAFSPRRKNVILVDGTSLTGDRLGIDEFFRHEPLQPDMFYIYVHRLKFSSVDADFPAAFQKALEYRQHHNVLILICYEHNVIMQDKLCFYAPFPQTAIHDSCEIDDYIQQICKSTLRDRIRAHYGGFANSSYDKRFTLPTLQIPHVKIYFTVQSVYMGHGSVYRIAPPTQAEIDLFSQERNPAPSIRVSPSSLSSPSTSSPDAPTITTETPESATDTVAQLTRLRSKYPQIDSILRKHGLDIDSAAGKAFLEQALFEDWILENQKHIDNLAYLVKKRAASSVHHTPDEAKRLLLDLLRSRVRSIRERVQDPAVQALTERILHSPETSMNDIGELFKHIAEQKRQNPTAGINESLISARDMVNIACMLQVGWKQRAKLEPCVTPLVDRYEDDQVGNSFAKIAKEVNLTDAWFSKSKIQNPERAARNRR